MATIIKVDGEEIIVKPENGNTELSLKQLQDAVEGHIELVSILNPIFKRKIMFCNEEGRLIGKRYNAKASAVAGQEIVGNVILCDKGEVS